jgi:NAD(P)H dehydrogenase (quinone)
MTTNRNLIANGAETLVIVAHPEPDAFNKAVLAEFLRGLAEGGYEAEIADLALEGFDPRITQADLSHYRSGSELSVDVKREQARVDAAAALVFISPIYWWSLPGLLKGWVDRVLTNGWAFAAGADGQVHGLLAERPVRLLATGSGDEPGYAKHGYRDAFAAQIERGIFGFCGLHDVAAHLLPDVESSDPTIRAAHLRTARGVGRSLFSQTKQSATA